MKEKENDGAKRTLQTEVKRQIHRLNFPLPARPLGRSGEPLYPELPVDLTSLNDARLMQLYGDFCRMAQYAQLSLAWLTVARAGRARAEKRTRAEVRLRKSGTVLDKEAQVETDFRVQKRVFAFLVADGAETITRSVLESYIIGRDAISRELTRRNTMISAEWKSR